MNKIKKNIAYNFIVQATAVLLPLLTTPYLSRILGAGGMGKYAYAYSVAYYFTLFIKLGLDYYGNRTIASVRSDKSRLSSTFWEIYYFQVITAIIGIVIYILYCLFVPTDSLLALIFVGLVFSAGIDITWFLYGIEEFKATMLRDTGIKVINTILIFVFVQTVDDVWKYVFIRSAGFFIAQVLSWPVLFKSICYVKPSLQSIKSHIKPNLILFIPVVSVSLYKVMDRVMLGRLSSLEELGYYYNVESVLSIPKALIVAVRTAMLPRMSLLVATEATEEQMKSIFFKTLEGTLFASSAAAFGLMSIAKEFVPIFFGSGFEKCIPLFFWIFSSIIPLVYTELTYTEFLLPRKKDIAFNIARIAGAVANLTLNLLLIPVLDSIGAAIATLVAEIFVCGSQMIALRRELKFREYLYHSLPYVLAGIIMVCIFYNADVSLGNSYISLLVKIIEAGSVYIIVSLLGIGARRILVRNNL